MASSTSSKQVYNFTAGPAMLPHDVMKIAQDEFLNYQGTGMNLMEMTHRGPHFQKVIDQATQDLRSLLQIPDSYEVLFYQGGATLHFSAIPMNLLEEGETADYSLTGVWAVKAYQEAKKFFPNVKSIYDGKPNLFREIPELNDKSINPDAKYLYITSNNTIYGTRYNPIPKIQSVPLVADMTSDILSRQIDVSSFGLIFAGAQKNIGPSGLTILIFDPKILRKKKSLPVLLDYDLMAKNKSLYNTPPTYPIYLSGLVFQWLLKQGGVSEMEKRNEEKAELLYHYLDNESKYFFAPVPKQFRSSMNVVFHCRDPHREKMFITESENEGFIGLAGHRDAGGLRASIYNAMPKEGVLSLIEYLKDFESR
jgi:phosphoserine aminotransferase